MTIDEQLKATLESMPRADLLGLVETGSRRRSQSPKLYRWLTANALDAITGTSDSPRLVPAEWNHRELTSGLRIVGIWCKVARDHQRPQLQALFATVLDALLEELTERRAFA